MPEEEDEIEIGSPKHVRQETSKISNDIETLKEELKATTEENGALEVIVETPLRQS